MSDDNNTVDSVTEFRSLISLWDNDREPDSLAETLTRLSEIIEKEVNDYYKLDPDPYDGLQPDEQNIEFSGSAWNQLATEIDELFIEKVIDLYILGTDRSSPILPLGIRLLYNLIPTSYGFTFEGDATREAGSLLEKLIAIANEAESGDTKYYVLALLGSSAECPYSNAQYHSVLERLACSSLREMQSFKSKFASELGRSEERPFAHFGAANDDASETSSVRTCKSQSEQCSQSSSRSLPTKTPSGKGQKRSSTGPNGGSRKKARRGSPPPQPPASKCKNAPQESHVGESSNSWVDISPLLTGTYFTSPLTDTMKQRLLLQFLVPLAEYQELLTMFLEEDSLGLVDFYLKINLHKDIRLTFEALRFLSGLLCHRRLAAKFVIDGIPKLLAVARPSVAATAVSMCLYYIACCKDVFERACGQLPHSTLRDMCSYMLWLLECSHETGRYHATMFFTEVFNFRCLLELFDEMDGLRRLINLIATLDTFRSFQTDSPPTGAALPGSQPDLGHQINHVPHARRRSIGSSHDGTETSDSNRQAIKQCCFALKSYFGMHLAIKTDQIRRAARITPLCLPHQGTRAAELTVSTQLKNMLFLLEHAAPKSSWHVVEQFQKQNGLVLLLQICFLAREWRNCAFRAETLKSAVDVIACITAYPKHQDLLSALVPVPHIPDELEEDPTHRLVDKVTGFRIVLNLAEGIAVTEADVQKAALRVIINCVCGAKGVQFSGLYGDEVYWANRHGKQAAYQPSTQHDDTLKKMCTAVRHNNGLQILLSLAVTKVPPQEADLIRTLACVALYGICLDEGVKQIISKMPLFSQSLLEIAMREPPVAADKKLSHDRFCEAGSVLLDKVVGKQNLPFPIASGARTSDELRRAEIVAQTRISWDSKELLCLIHEHLLTSGLHKASKALFEEADLASYHALNRTAPITIVPKPLVSTPRLSVKVREPGEPMEITRLPPATPAYLPLSTPTQRIDFPRHDSTATHQTSPENNPCTTPVAKQRVNSATPEVFSSVKRQSRLGRGAGVAVQSESASAAGSSMAHTPFTPASAIAPTHATWKMPPPSTGRTLNNIVESYLESQHSKCLRPIVFCPPFSLREQHKCPEPLCRKTAPLSIANRLLLRKVYSPHGGMEGKSFSRKFIHSRFRPVATYQDSNLDRDTFFTSVCFSPDRHFFYVGTNKGEVRQHDPTSADFQSPAQTFYCHDSAIATLDMSHDCRMLLTTVSWGSPGGSLWVPAQDEDGISKLMDFEDEIYCEFTKTNQDMVIGTVSERATIYDIGTCRKIRTLYDSKFANDYVMNMATSSYHNDQIILNDGTLWDLRQESPIHKFDKFNANMAGGFHPNCLEIIINCEVWDLRTWNLLQTVPALDQCFKWFNNARDVMYTSAFTSVHEDRSITMSTQIKTVDAIDYQTIATLDVKKKVGDVAIDPKDQYIAVIENGSGFMSESGVCKLYEVGMPREPDQEDEENSDDNEDDDDEDDEDDDENDDEVIFDDILNAFGDQGEEGDGYNSDQSDMYSTTSGSDDMD